VYINISHLSHFGNQIQRGQTNFLFDTIELPALSNFVHFYKIFIKENIKIRIKQIKE